MLVVTFSRIKQPNVSVSKYRVFVEECRCMNHPIITVPVLSDLANNTTDFMTIL